jgi:hypothetical protein
MPIHCRHEAKDYSLPTDRNPQPSRDGNTAQTDGYTHVIDPSYAPEKHFEPWNLSDVLKNRKSSSNNEKLNATSCSECFFNDLKYTTLSIIQLNHPIRHVFRATMVGMKSNKLKKMKNGYVSYCLYGMLNG